MNKKILISSCTGGFRNFSLNKTLDILTSMGFRYIEGTTDGKTHLYEYIFQGKDHKILKKLLRKYKIGITAVSGGWSDFAVVDRYLKKQYRSLNKQLIFCQRFNVKILRIFTSHLPGQYVEDKIIKRIIRNLKRIMPEAKKANVILVIENHFGTTATADNMIRIIEGVAHSNLKINFDAANFLPMKQDPVKVCKKLLPHIAHLHLKDLVLTKQSPDYNNAYLTGRDIFRGYKFCPLGKGIINYKKIFELLKNAKYNGIYSIEYENTSDPVHGTKSSYKNLKKMLNTK